MLKLRIFCFILPMLSKNLTNIRAKSSIFDSMGNFAASDFDVQVHDDSYLDVW